MGSYIPDKEYLDKSKKWYVIDANEAVLGRLATRAAEILMGKHKPEYISFLDTGDFVIIVNADKVRLTGKKLEKKVYRWHTMYMGGLKEAKARDRLNKKPERMVTEAIAGMLPKSKLGKKMVKKLKVYVGDSHPHAAQKPVALSL
jgi:large subunit ribosomal protein L13